MADFLSLPDATAGRKRLAPGLSVERKRHRRHGKKLQSKESTFEMRVYGYTESGDRRVYMSQFHLREAITTAITTMYGEEQWRRYLRWDILDFNDNTKDATVLLTSTSSDIFVGALALLPMSEGRVIASQNRR